MGHILLRIIENSTVQSYSWSDEDLPKGQLPIGKTIIQKKNNFTFFKEKIPETFFF